jgi:AraC-like DNA-binding protein
MSPTAQLSSSRTESSSSRQSWTSLIRDIEATQAVVISSGPRGRLQIVQPQKVSDALVRAYDREFQTEDQASWRAIADQNVARVARGGRYAQDFLRDFGFAHAAAAPLAGPIFPGYPGSIQLFRTAEQGDFSDVDLRRLGEAATRFDELTASARESRTTVSDSGVAALKRPAVSEFIFDGKAEVRLFQSAFDELDERIRQQIIAQVRQRISRLESQSADATDWSRVSLPDSDGDHLAFNFVVYREYPALGSGPFVFVCLLPTVSDWSAVRASDFQADDELSRLVPSIKFMQQEFQRGPALTEISKAAHLSPFHFHRQFAEHLGLTPKHFLMECQIHECKKQLLARQKDLAKIASDCGFAHQSHFTSRFKQITGLTPTRWRRMAIRRTESAKD